jgi:hypothetical protein
VPEHFSKLTNAFLVAEIRRGKFIQTNSPARGRFDKKIAKHWRRYLFYFTYLLDIFVALTITPNASFLPDHNCGIKKSLVFFLIKNFVN